MMSLMTSIVVIVVWALVAFLCANAQPAKVQTLALFFFTFLPVVFVLAPMRRSPLLEIALSWAPNLSERIVRIAVRDRKFWILCLFLGPGYFVFLSACGSLWAFSLLGFVGISLRLVRYYLLAVSSRLLGLCKFELRHGRVASTGVSGPLVTSARLYFESIVKCEQSMVLFLILLVLEVASFLGWYVGWPEGWRTESETGPVVVALLVANLSGSIYLELKQFFERRIFALSFAPRRRLAYVQLGGGFLQDIPAILLVLAVCLAWSKAAGGPLLVTLVVIKCLAAFVFCRLSYFTAVHLRHWRLPDGLLLSLGILALTAILLFSGGLGLLLFCIPLTCAFVLFFLSTRS